MKGDKDGGIDVPPPIYIMSMALLPMNRKYVCVCTSQERDAVSVSKHKTNTDSSEDTFLHTIDCRCVNCN